MTGSASEQKHNSLPPALAYVIFAIMALWLASTSALANESNDFRVGAKVTSFVGASPRDAEIAMSMIVEDLMQVPPHGFTESYRELDVVFFHTDEDFKKAVESNEFDMLLGSTTELLDTIDHVGHGYFYTFDVGGRDKSRYVLVTQKDSAFQSVDNVSGARFVAPSGAELGMTWMRQILANAGDGVYKQLVSNHKQTTDYIDAVNKLYFDQADVALVTRESLDVSIELNPQIGKKLHVIAESVPLLGMVLVPVGLPNELEVFDKTMRNFHATESGKTLLSLFRCTRVNRGDIADLEPIRALLSSVDS